MTDICPICGEPYDDYNEWILVEPQNKEVFTFNICMECNDDGRFKKFLERTLLIKRTVFDEIVGAAECLDSEEDE